MPNHPHPNPTPRAVGEATKGDAAALARLMIASGSPEMLYEMGERFPVGDPARDACFKAAAVLSRLARMGATTDAAT